MELSDGFSFFAHVSLAVAMARRLFWQAIRMLSWCGREAAQGRTVAKARRHNRGKPITTVHGEFRHVLFWSRELDKLTYLRRLFAGPKK
jgi:hypothetical protein